MKIKKEEVKHWLGNSHEDWIEDLLFRLMNNKVSVKDIRDEAKQMYKDSEKSSKFKVTIILDVAEQSIVDMSLNAGVYIQEDLEDGCLYIEDIKKITNK